MQKGLHPPYLILPQKFYITLVTFRHTNNVEKVRKWVAMQWFQMTPLVCCGKVVRVTLHLTSNSRITFLFWSVYHVGSSKTGLCVMSNTFCVQMRYEHDKIDELEMTMGPNLLCKWVWSPFLSLKTIACPCQINKTLDTMTHLMHLP